jgi:glycosyltransferase involved in cell wall biosynthesis
MHPAVGFGFSRAACERHVADLSVVIPIYNHERFVGAAIESALSQTARPREILCIDDGSTDGSASIAESLASRHPSVRVWSRPNQGAHHTINEGIREARGRYVAILNSDDLYHHERLVRCLAVLEADPGAAAVATRISFVNAHGNPIQYSWYEEACAFYEKIGDLGLALVNANFLMTTSNIVARRVVFEEVGGFDDLRYAHDLDFFLRLVVHRKRLALLRRPLLSYRIHDGNTISEAHLQVRLEWAVVAAVFAQRFASAKDALDPCSQYLARLLEVTDRHQLTRLVALSLLHAQRGGAGAVSPGACLADRDFRAALREIAQ